MMDPIFSQSSFGAAVLKTIKTFSIFSAVICSMVIFCLDHCEAQMPLPVYLAPTPVVKVQRSFLHHRTYYAPTAVAYPAVTTAYYAPQVPVVPMATEPVPTMSAYYVPTVPVVQPYYSTVIPRRRLRHYAVPVAPAVIHPVYWAPF